MISDGCQNSISIINVVCCLLIYIGQLHFSGHGIFCHMFSISDVSWYLLCRRPIPGLWNLPDHRDQVIWLRPRNNR